jgi:hypothetical protein
MKKTMDNEIQEEIEYYKVRIMQDPEGRTLYEAMINSLKKTLKLRGGVKNAISQKRANGKKGLSLS